MKKWIKIKERIKKIVFTKLTPKPKKPKKNKLAMRRLGNLSSKENSSFQETVAVNTKFSHPENISRFPRMPQDIPYSYDQDRIVLQVRDPHWLHTYWELRNQTLEGLRMRLGSEFERSKRVLRIYDVTNIVFNGSNANSFFDIQINDFTNSWYINANGPGRSWCVDLGLMLPDGRFIMVVRSNIVQTPSDTSSWITDEEWMIPDEMFARLYGMGFGLGRSSPVGRAWQERIKQGLFSSGISSSPVRKEAKEKKFWMKVDCELIVYGATDPSAKVTVQGKPINLRPDGTFTLRFWLPDGKQCIPVKAVSSDKLEERTITPIVNRETK